MPFFSSVKVKEKFIRIIEIEHGSACCIYRRIPKPITIHGMSRNAARCWNDRSELVRFESNEEIISIVE